MRWAKELILTLLFTALAGSESRRKVQFELPSSDSTARTSFSSQISSDSSTSSSDDSVEYADPKSESFRRLRLDDDKITARIGKQKKEKRKKKKTKTKKKKHLQRQNKTENEKTKRFSHGSRINEDDENGPIFTEAWLRRVEHDENIGLNGSKSLNSLQELNSIKDPLNVGWLLFAFRAGSSKTFSTNFEFKTDQPVRVSLVDLFCRGDSFSIWDKGQLVAQSSRALADADCEERMISPFEAMQDGRWSSVVFELRSGDHNLVIKTVDSPFQGEGGGVAAIRFDKLVQPRRVSRNKVCRGFNGLIVVKVSVDAEEAESICSGLHTNLAQIKNLSDSAVLKSVKECSGSKGSVWALDGQGQIANLVLIDALESKFTYDEGSHHEKHEVICQVR